MAIRCPVAKARRTSSCQASGSTPKLSVTNLTGSFRHSLI
jgi:hypothetical protein